MRFTLLAPNAFRKIQFNAGVMAKTFDPFNPGVPGGIIGATSGGFNFTATPTFIDYGEDIDNCPKNTMELKRQKEVEVKISGTMLTIDATAVSMLMAASTVDSTGTATKITPKLDISTSDFGDLWWIGDYSDDNSASTGGFAAIKIKNALSTGGLQVQTGDEAKGQFAFEFTGHYSANAASVVPYEVYIMSGVAPTLVVTSVAGTSTGKTALTVGGYVLAAGESWVYKTAESVTLPSEGDSLASGWTAWDGGEVSASTDNEIAIAAVDASTKAIASGKTTVVSKA